MLRTLPIAAIAFVLVCQPASAQIIDNKKKCLSHLAIIKQMEKDETIGPKLEPIVDELIKVLTSYCESEKFDSADEVANAIRGLLATEHSGG